MVLYFCQIENSRKVNFWLKEMDMRRFAAVLIMTFLVPSIQSSVYAHCEIPCGIYGDEARFTALYEDITTIEKSMVQIGELSGDLNNVNQLVRWVNNKETHSDHVREVVSQYFLAQRVKVPADGNPAASEMYAKKLALLHQIIVSAMKCKQTTELVNVETLHDLVHSFQEVYDQK